VQHRDRLPGVDPSARLQQRVAVAEHTVERGAQLEAAQLGALRVELGDGRGESLGEQRAPLGAVAAPDAAVELRRERVGARAGERRAVVDVGRVQPREQLARAHRARLAQLDDAGRQRAVDQLLALGVHPPLGAHRQAPRPREQHDGEREAGEREQLARAPGLGAPRVPHPHLGEHRPRDEPGDLDDEQQHAEQLEEEQVDRDRDGQEHHAAGRAR
jgi:hypothetical protein